MYEWQLNQRNLITFVMVDSNGTEVAGLGGGFTLQISKAGGAFAASGGDKAEIGSGWYSYNALAAEADMAGPVAIRVTGAGAVQQNLEYVVVNRTILAQPRTYTVDDGANPIAGAEVWIGTSSSQDSIFWYGTTDTLGVARDTAGNMPYLAPGTYYFWVLADGYTFTLPDTEVFS